MKYKRGWAMVLLPISGMLLWIAYRYENIAEMVFSRRVYKEVAGLIYGITGKFSFSIMEASFIFLPFLFLAIGFTYIYGYRKKVLKGKEILTRIFYNVLAFLSIGVFLYTILCGMNYHRYSFAKVSGLTIRQVEKKELKELSFYLVKQAKEVRSKMNTSGETWNYERMAQESMKAMKNLGKKYPVLDRSYPRPKAVIQSDIMSTLGITGIFWPFSVEANVNVRVEKHTIPAVMCHELAHVSGFMREDEANFIAYLACKYSENLEFQYSGYMMALEYTTDRLYKVDKEAYIEVEKTYSEEMKEDIRADYTYWKKYQDSSVREASKYINDSYLKANNQNDGIMSYGRMVDLLLADHKKTKENSR